MQEATILIADEDQSTLNKLKELLVKDGYSVITAIDGVDAVTKAAISSLKVVITNLNMPLFPGLKVLERIKKFYPQLHVIMMSDISPEETKRKALEFGAYSFLEKPIDPFILRKQIKDIFNQHVNVKP